MTMTYASSPLRPLTLAILAFLVAAPARGQETGTVEGLVILAATGAPAGSARILLPRLGLFTTADETGRFVLERVPAGEHEILAERGSLQSGRIPLFVAAHQVVTVELAISETFVLEQLTVTGVASGVASDRELFNSVSTLSREGIAENAAPTLAQALNGQPGVSMRSFGPGAARPIIRGFDGDRVLITQDGVRTGDLSSQSGDHGSTVDPTSLRRLEVVKGPATLLFGSNAIGGVVNAVTNHDYYRTPPPSGSRGGAILDGATANKQVGANAWVQFGTDGWLVWGNGGYRQSEDYDTPEGRVPNSATDLANGGLGVGYFGPRAFFTVGGTSETGSYGVPFAGEFEGGEGGEPEDIVLDARRTAVRGTFGLLNLDSWLQSVRVALNFTDWRHEELHGGSPETTFDNQTLVYRIDLEQSRDRWWGGSFGASGLYRDYVTQGAEALSPPVVHNGFAAFVVEEFDLTEARVQIGARLEGNRYDVEADDLPDRTFFGVSTSLGINVPLGGTANLYTNLTQSYRAPALEELYNNGPHVGTLTFEVGDPNLERELSLGIDAGLKHDSDRVRTELSGFYYDLNDYVFTRLTGEVEDGLQVGEFTQADARYAGFELLADFMLTADLWLNLRSDYVRAELKDGGLGLPRIPPIRGRAALDWHVGSFRVQPEVVLAGSQTRTFTNETETDGYTLANLVASYTFQRAGQQHRLTLRFDNLTDELYRNHSSFIKDLAPEMGRSVRLSYTAELF